MINDHKKPYNCCLLQRCFLQYYIWIRSPIESFPPQSSSISRDMFMVIQVSRSWGRNSSKGKKLTESSSTIPHWKLHIKTTQGSSRRNSFHGAHDLHYISLFCLYFLHLIKLIYDLIIKLSQALECSWPSGYSSGLMIVIVFKTPDIDLDKNLIIGRYRRCSQQYK